MNILFYTILFIIGIVIGSFWAVGSSKMPKNLDLKKVHYSKYKHEDTMSKITYIFMGGVLSVLLANILDMHIDEFDMTKIIIYIFTILTS